MNPYRASFYQRQAEWHGYEDPETALERHELRAPYFEWYTRGWLPEDREARILDIGCGSGQFLYFLRNQGFNRAEGIDVDRDQVAIAQGLGLNAIVGDAQSHLDRPGPSYDLIVILDVLEHLTRNELYQFMEAVVRRLGPGGRLIASVPNAESPDGLRCTFTDITHESAFTPTSFKQMLFCHGIVLQTFRDPWPVPVGWKRRLYRGIVTSARLVEALRLRLLGFQPPHVWSNTMWILATKGSTEPPTIVPPRMSRQDDRPRTVRGVSTTR